MNTPAGVDHASLAVTEQDRSERYGVTVFKVAAQGEGRPRSLALVILIVVAACLTSCADDNDERRASTPTTPPSSDVDNSSPPTFAGEQIIVKTRIAGFTGKVLTGSVLGGAPFCPGGAVRHEHGSPDLGFPAVNVFTCEGGALRVGFGPGPDQMDQAVQTSDWRVLDGTGNFAGATGEGTMRVEFEDRDAAIGHETFVGQVVVP